MPNIGDSERKTQNRVVKFFRDKLHYTYLGNLHDSENRNIMQERLHAWLLKQGYSEKLASNAVDALVKTSTNLQQRLYHANKEVYSLLKYGAKVKESVEQSPKTVYFIDFEDASKNDFYIAEEVTIVSNNTKRPDIVIYVNGIALAVIELKKSSVSVSNGIRQNLTNQKSNFIEDFFTTIQFCMAGNDSETFRRFFIVSSLSSERPLSLPRRSTIWNGKTTALPSIRRNAILWISRLRNTARGFPASWKNSFLLCFTKSVSLI
jgi:type I restriction enzyme R subunit